MRKTILLLGAALIAATGVNADAKDRKKDKAESEEASKDKAETKVLSAFVEGFEKSDGLFPLYRDGKTGEVYIELDADQLGREFIYFTYTENGPIDAGHFRGSFRDNRVIVFNRRYDRVEVEAVNTSYYFDPANPISRASNANVARAPLANVKIAAESPDKRKVLVSADALLEKEALNRIQPWQDPEAKPGATFVLGELSSDKTQIESFANFPKNTDIRVEYVYDNPKPINYGTPDVTDPRSVAILVQHSFLSMPEPGFVPRADDQRVGYFTNEATDLTSTSYAPYRDLINRWRLEKKDPGAAVSDPVVPITFWIENTTPVELRGLIRDAALRWNDAFVAAGISNAVEVKIQPDDATWAAGDLRYNVLRWTSSPNPPFGGYGPSFTNPRTGEILGADIMLEYVFLTNRLNASEIFDTMGLPAHSRSDDHSEASLRIRGGSDCTVASQLQSNLMLARAMAGTQAAGDIGSNELVRQSLYYLIIHEIGHTLGLNHNMRSSSTVPLASLNKPGVAPSNSVMDYPPVNIAAPGETQGQYMVERPGPYDVWAIQFGYTPDADKIGPILARSTEPQLAFGNDADDMRSPGVHIDPRVMIDDLSTDPITWAASRATLIDQTMAVLPSRVLEAGDSYQSLYGSYMILTGQKANTATIASRWIGGVFNNRGVVGQPGAEQPLVPVPAAEQRRALGVVGKIAFAPDAFAAGESLLDRLQVQRRGFNSFGTNVDPKPHARALKIQRGLLDHLLHPNVLARLTDTRRYGGDYPVSAYMSELTGVMFDADQATAVNTYRQNLQIEYVTRLIDIASGKGGGVQQTPSGPQPLPKHDYVGRSAVLASLARIKALAARPAADGETRAHRGHMLSLIEEFERR